MCAYEVVWCARSYMHTLPLPTWECIMCACVHEMCIWMCACNVHIYVCIKCAYEYAHELMCACVHVMCIWMCAWKVHMNVRTKYVHELCKSTGCTHRWATVMCAYACVRVWVCLCIWMRTHHTRSYAHVMKRAYECVHEKCLWMCVMVTIVICAHECAHITHSYAHVTVTHIHMYSNHAHSHTHSMHTKVSNGNVCICISAWMCVTVMRAYECAICAHMNVCGSTMCIRMCLMCVWMWISAWMRVTVMRAYECVMCAHMNVCDGNTCIWMRLMCAHMNVTFICAHTTHSCAHMNVIFIWAHITHSRYYIRRLLKTVVLFCRI